MASKFTLNPNIVAELGATPGMTSAMQQTADAIIAAAAGITSSHDFANTLEVLDVSEGANGVVMVVGTRWPFGHLVEWGSVNNPAQAPLRKAVSSLGLKFEEK
jgi:hypothetical protein